VYWSVWAFLDEGTSHCRLTELSTAHCCLFSAPTLQGQARRSPRCPRRGCDASPPGEPGLPADPASSSSSSANLHLAARCNVSKVELSESRVPNTPKASRRLMLLRCSDQRRQPRRRKRPSLILNRQSPTRTTWLTSFRPKSLDRSASRCRASSPAWAQLKKHGRNRASRRLLPCWDREAANRVLLR
jgi:hypothetical protein